MDIPAAHFVVFYNALKTKLLEKDFPPDLKYSSEAAFFSTTSGSSGVPIIQKLFNVSVNYFPTLYSKAQNKSKNSDITMTEKNAIATLAYILGENVPKDKVKDESFRKRLWNLFLNVYQVEIFDLKKKPIDSIIYSKTDIIDPLNIFKQSLPVESLYALNQYFENIIAGNYQGAFSICEDSLKNADGFKEFSVSFSNTKRIRNVQILNYEKVSDIVIDCTISFKEEIVVPIIPELAILQTLTFEHINQFQETANTLISKLSFIKQFSISNLTDPTFLGNPWLPMLEIQKHFPRKQYVVVDKIISIQLSYFEKEWFIRDSRVVTSYISK